jgi:hypothetical protein
LEALVVFLSAALSFLLTLGEDDPQEELLGEDEERLGLLAGV